MAKLTDISGVSDNFDGQNLVTIAHLGLMPWISRLKDSFKFNSLLISGFLFYIAVVRLLRYRRRNNVLRRYAHWTRESFQQMTLEEAYKIQLDLAELEFPTIFSASVFFALFKTYGIPSISRLLVSTGELSKHSTASKRAAETGIILTEIVLNDPRSSRAHDAIARMNYLHDKYRRSGKIFDDDMLYTLSLFALEPIRWTNAFEWRNLTPFERCAMGVYWRWMSVAMEIPCDALKPFVSESHDDGLAWLDALEAWSLQYEAERMRPHTANKKVSQATLDIALHLVPRPLQTFALGLISALLQPRLRTAMMLPSPTQLHSTILHSAVTLRRYFIRFLLPPRPAFLRTQWFSSPDPKTGRIHANQYIAEPWYVKPTFGSRWGFEALRQRLWGGALPGDDAKYRPEGYIVGELGPERWTGHGESEMRGTRERLARDVGCSMFR